MAHRVGPMRGPGSAPRRFSKPSPWCTNRHCGNVGLGRDSSVADMTVVIPTFNRGSLLTPTVEHLLQSRREGIGEVEVIVVDDGSTPPASEYLRTIPSSLPFAFRVV